MCSSPNLRHVRYGSASRPGTRQTLCPVGRTPGEQRQARRAPANGRARAIRIGDPTTKTGIFILAGGRAFCQMRPITSRHTPTPSRPRRMSPLTLGPQISASVVAHDGGVGCRVVHRAVVSGHALGAGRGRTSNLVPASCWLDDSCAFSSD